MGAGVDRLSGYRDALTEAGRPIDERLIVTADFTQEAGAAAMEHLLKSNPAIDAVFAASDLIAAGALSVLDVAGRRVPEDVALVGYDDSPIALSVRPQLTSVRQPIEEMGQEMARVLIAALEEAEPVQRRVILATELIKRASSAGRPMP
jgi:DNA-binding LacI/PurR family transcriptional regulator